ncbi:MAG TPA: hypothetical protein VFR84_15560 [Candidatus Angelobacter sp.]|nr:hypothetical protein [Candidatus Angelobacter sp.]
MTDIRQDFAVIETGRVHNFSTRLMLGGYFADIVSNPGHNVCHWVVQRVGSPEVLRLGQEHSFPLALERAHQCLESLAVRSRKNTHRAALYHYGESR